MDFLIMAWAKRYVNNIVAGLAKGLTPKVVESLPTSNIRTDILYLVKRIDADDNNYFDEYLYVNGKWELIASTKIDLDGYVTIDQLNAAVEEALRNAKESGLFNGAPGVGIVSIKIKEKTE